MSQLVHVDLQFKHRALLLAAIEALGLTTRDNHPVRFYQGHSTPCEFMIPLEGPYDVGFRRNPSQTYDVVCDNEVLAPHPTSRSVHAHQIVGAGLNKLRQEYTYQALAKHAALTNHLITRSQRDDGSLVIELQEHGT